VKRAFYSANFNPVLFGTAIGTSGSKTLLLFTVMTVSAGREMGSPGSAGKLSINTALQGTGAHYSPWEGHSSLTLSTIGM